MELEMVRMGGDRIRDEGREKGRGRGRGQKSFNQLH